MSSVLKFRPVVSRSRHYFRPFSTMQDSYYGEEHKSMQDTLKKIIDNDINPHVDSWEASGEFYPAHKIFKILGNAGLLGINKPVEYGGLGLDLKFNVALNEALGHINCGAIPMSVAVQTDMATPALAR
jgi:citronellyl-CoA dehydrogenase